jgi:hypothetical protein
MSLLPRTPIMRRSFIARTDHRRMGPAISGCRPGVAIAGESGAGGAGGNSPGSAAAHGAPASPTPTTTSVHTPARSECFIESLPGVCCPITPAVYHPVQRHEVVERTQPFVPRAWLREFLSRRRSPRDEVVDVTMNGEDDASHYLSEYFGSCRCGAGPGAISDVLAQSERATRHRLVVACSGSGAAIPAIDGM